MTAFGRSAALRAALQMTGSTYVVYATGLVVSAVIARSIGPDDFGRYSYVVWLVGVLILLSNNGITTSVIRFVSESRGRGQPGQAAAVHGWLGHLQWACVLLVAAGYLVAMPWLSPAGWEGQGRDPLLALLVLVALYAKGRFMFEISVAKGHGRFDVEALTTVLVSLANVAAVLFLAWRGAPLTAYLVLFAATCLAYGLAGAWMLHRGGMRPRRAPLDPRLRRRIGHHLGWTLLLVAASVFTNKSVETWLLNALVGAAEVGYFMLAAALARGGVDLLSSGLNSVLMPAMAHAFGAGGSMRVQAILSRSVRYFHFLGLLLAGVGVCWAAVAVRMLYGPQYATVTWLLQVMVLVGGLTLAEGAFGALLSTTDNQRIRAAFGIASIIIGAGAALALIPPFGLAGAIAAHAVSRLLVFALTMGGITRMMRLRLPWRQLARLSLAAVAAGVVAAATRLGVGGLAGGLLAGVAYALVFVVATAGFRAWRQDDADPLVALLERVPPMRPLAGPLQRWAGRLPS